MQKKEDDGVDGCVDDCADGCVGSHIDSCVDVAKEDGVDGGNNHLTHLTQEVDCHLKARKKQNTRGPNATKNRSVLYES
eukprot:6463827-Ditylum_brightwellii.AAC.1